MLTSCTMDHTDATLPCICGADHRLSTWTSRCATASNFTVTFTPRVPRSRRKAWEDPWPGRR